MYFHHHHHQGLDPLIRSVSRVTTALSNVSAVFQLFFFLVVCSDMISKGFSVVAFFASVKASSVCIRLSCLVCIQSVVHGVRSRLFCGHKRCSLPEVSITSFLPLQFFIPKVCTFTWCTLNMVQYLAWWWLYELILVATFIIENKLVVFWLNLLSGYVKFAACGLTHHLSKLLKAASHKDISLRITIRLSAGWLVNFLDKFQQTGLRRIFTN